MSLLYSSHKYGPHFMEAYQQVANSATYKKHRTGATTVYINGLKIYQYPRGDVVVLSGSRYIRCGGGKGRGSRGRRGGSRGGRARFPVWQGEAPWGGRGEVTGVGGVRIPGWEV